VANAGNAGELCEAAVRIEMGDGKSKEIDPSRILLVVSKRALEESAILDDGGKFARLVDLAIRRPSASERPFRESIPRPFERRTRCVGRTPAGIRI